MENKELSGVLFPNKKMADRQPDCRGSVRVNGVDYEVAGWKRQSRSGISYVSLALQVKGQNQRQAAPVHTPKETVNQVAQAFEGPEEIIADNAISEELPF